MKMKFESNHDLPLGKILSIPVCIIVAGSVFQEDNNHYPQVYCMNVFMSVRMNFYESYFYPSVT